MSQICKSTCNFD